MVDLSTLKNLIKIKSDENPNNILEYIKNELSGKVCEISEVKNKEDNKSNLIIGINCMLKNVEPIVLSGHIDTVGADLNKYETEPFSLTIKDGKAYGLGSIDMKCFCSTIIDMIDNLKSNKEAIIFCLTGDEETNLYGINNIICEFKKLNIKPKFTIIGEPTNLKINNVSNGCFEYKVEVFGKGCHSSTPENGINAICVISRLVTYIEELSNNYTNLTMSCDLISGGTIINRVADYASMSFDIRTVSIANYNEVLECIKKEVKRLETLYGCTIKIENKLRIPPLSNNNEEKIKRISDSMNVEIDTFVGGCEAGYYKEYSGDAILFGVGDLKLAHKPNEYLVVNEYEKYNKLLINLINVVKELY